jgi:hypothetical protein
LLLHIALIIFKATDSLHKLNTNRPIPYFSKCFKQNIEIGLYDTNAVSETVLSTGAIKINTIALQSDISLTRKCSL